MSSATGVDGMPIMAMSTNTPRQLTVVHCKTYSCSVLDAPTVLDAAVTAGTVASSLVIGIDGFPLVAWEDNTAGNLLFSRCITISCSSVGAAQIADSGSVGRYASMLLDPNTAVPTIVYQDWANFRVKVVRCADTVCSSFQAPVTINDPIATSASGGQGASAIIGADGFPVIFYNVPTAPQGLRVFKCFDPSCATGAADWIDTGIDVQWTSATVGPDGHPIVAYSTASAQIKFAYCVAPSCLGGAVAIATPVPSGAGGQLSLTISADDLPIFASSDVSGLFVYYCANFACTSGTQLVVDNSGGGSLQSTLTIAGDRFPTMFLSLSSAIAIVHPNRRR
jgi:hypothetical protein